MVLAYVFSIWGLAQAAALFKANYVLALANE